MNNLREEIDTMLHCFKNVLKWSRIELTTSLDIPEKSNIKEHLKNMYGIDIVIWQLHDDCHVQYMLTDSNKRHKLFVTVGYIKTIRPHLFKDDECNYSPLSIEMDKHEHIFKTFEEELEYHLDAYFLENDNRTQLLHTNLDGSERPLEDRVVYSIDSPKIIQDPDPNTIPDADTRTLLFIYYVKHKETGKSYRIMVDCMLDCRAFIPILKYRRVTVTTGKPTMEKR